MGSAFHQRWRREGMQCQQKFKKIVLFNTIDSDVARVHIYDTVHNGLFAVLLRDSWFFGYRIGSPT